MRRALLFLVVAVMVGMLGCESAMDKKTSAAREVAQKKLVALKTIENRSDAKKLAKEIENLNPNPDLTKADWLMKVGAVNEKDMADFFKRAAAREANAIALNMRKIKANPTEAFRLKAAFLAAQGQSGRDIQSFGMTIARLDRIVEDNMNQAGIKTTGPIHAKKHKAAKTAKTIKKRLVVAKK